MFLKDSEMASALVELSVLSPLEGCLDSLSAGYTNDSNFEPCTLWFSQIMSWVKNRTWLLTRHTERIFFSSKKFIVFLSEWMSYYYYF